MSYKLYLDDIREPPYENWVLVKSYKEFIEYIEENGFPTDISFDHDLGTKRGTKTGYDCIKWLVGEDMDNRGDITQIQMSVHSANPVGRVNIQKYIKNYLEVKKAKQEAAAAEKQEELPLKLSETEGDSK